MPSRNVNLTDELDSFVLAKVKSGRYENSSEVVRAALRTLEREERQFEAKLAAGSEGLPPNRLATVLYEDLAADPAGEIERLYGRLELGDFEVVRSTIREEAGRRRDYHPRSQPSPEPWRSRIDEEWAGVAARYGYRGA